MCYQKILLFKFFGNTLYKNYKKQNPFYYIKITLRTFKKLVLTTITHQNYALFPNIIWKFYPQVLLYVT
jgi:hypothetical protein